MMSGHTDATPSDINPLLAAEGGGNGLNRVLADAPLAMNEQSTKARCCQTLASATIATLSIILYAVLNSDESTEVIISCVASNWLVNFLGAKETIDQVKAIIQDPSLLPHEKRNQIIRFGASGLIVGAGAAFIGLGAAQGSSDFIKFLTAISNALANFVLGGMAMKGASKPVMEFYAWLFKNSPDEKQTRQLISFLERQKASLAHAPLARFTPTNGAPDPRSPQAKATQRNLIKSWRKYFFDRRLRDYEAAKAANGAESEGMPLLPITNRASAPVADAQKNKQFFDLLSDMLKHEIAAEAPENRSRLAQWSGPVFTRIGETLLFLLRYGGGGLAAYLMLCSSIGYLWTGQEATRKEVSALDQEWSSLLITFITQSLNLVLNLVAGFSLADTLATMAELIIKYGRLDLVRGGVLGFIFALCTTGGIAYMASDSGASSQNAFDHGSDSKVSQWLIWFMVLISRAGLDRRKILGIGATAFNSFFSVKAAIQVLKCFVLDRICRPEYIIVDQKIELLDTLIASIKLFSPAQMKEFCDELKAQAHQNINSPLHKELIAALQTAGILKLDLTDAQVDYVPRNGVI